MGKPDKNTLSLGLSFENDESTKSAVISPDGLYRSTLVRRWDIRKPTVYWVCLNPSVADAEAEDPTSGRIMSFSRSLGAGRYVLENLFSYRATSPTRLKKEYDRVHAEVMETATSEREKLTIGVLAKQKAGEFIMGPDNLATLKAMLTQAKAEGARVLCGWGAAPILKHIAAHDNFVRMAKAAGVELECLTHTEGDDKLPAQPRHPLYVPGITAPVSLTLKGSSDENNQ